MVTDAISALGMETSEADTMVNQMAKIAVQYFDTETLDLSETEMHMTGFKSKL